MAHFTQMDNGVLIVTPDAEKVLEKMLEKFPESRRGKNERSFIVTSREMFDKATNALREVYCGFSTCKKAEYIKGVAWKDLPELPENEIEIYVRPLTLSII